MQTPINEMRAAGKRAIEAYRGDGLAPLLIEAVDELEARGIGQIYGRAEDAFQRAAEDDNELRSLSESIMAGCEELQRFDRRLQTLLEDRQAAAPDSDGGDGSGEPVNLSGVEAPPAGSDDNRNRDFVNPPAADGPGAAGGDFADDPDADRPVVPEDG